MAMLNNQMVYRFIHHISYIDITTGHRSPPGLLWSHGAPHSGTSGGAALGDAVLHAANAACISRCCLEISGDILESWGYQIYVYIYKCIYIYIVDAL
jgi:hypothetical protein